MRKSLIVDDFELGNIVSLVILSEKFFEDNFNRCQFLNYEIYRNISEDSVLAKNIKTYDDVGSRYACSIGEK